MTIPKDHLARRGDGKEISATLGVFPILRELEKGKLQAIGTGFYVTRYGLFITARHVFDHIIEAEDPSLLTLRIFHHTGSEIHIRHIRRITVSNVADIALGEADNFSKKYPDNPLQNIRAKLTLSIPRIGEKLVTFSYPRNALLDFTGPTKPVKIFAGRFEGHFEEIMEPGKYDENKIQYYQCSIPLEGGCSGGPVFNEKGQVVAIARSGFDFGSDTDDVSPVSTLTPIRYCLPLNVSKDFIPNGSWEYNQLQQCEYTKVLDVRNLALMGHIEFEPQLV